MTYLDTHAVIWLYGGELNKFSEDIKDRLRDDDLLISPIVRLELTLLYEIGRLGADADSTLAFLKQKLGLQICGKPFDNIISQASSLNWTRDPFDRIIVAHAKINSNLLISKDREIREHYSHAIW